MDVLLDLLHQRQAIGSLYTAGVEPGVPENPKAAEEILLAWERAVRARGGSEGAGCLGAHLGPTPALGLMSASSLCTLHAAVWRLAAERGTALPAPSAAQFSALLVASLKQLERLHVQASSSLVGQRLEQVLEMSDLGWYDYALGSNTVRIGGQMADEWKLPPHCDLATVFERIHADDRAEVQRRGDAAVLGQEEFRHEYRLQVDGAEEWVDARGRVLQDPRGRAPRLVGTVRNITARRALHEKIDNERAWLQMVLNQLPVSVLMLEAGSGRPLFCNEVAASFLGASWMQNGCSRDCIDHYDLRDRDGVRLDEESMPTARALRGETLAGLELSWHHEDGVRDLVFSSANLEATPGHAATLVCLFQDVTALKVHQRQLTDRLDQHREDFAARDCHLRTLLHDVRTPLAAASLAADGALRSLTRDASKIPAQLERVRNNLRRLDDMLERMLDNSRAQLGSEVPIRRQHASLGQVLAEGVAELNAVHEGRVQFHNEVGEALLLCDEQALRRVLDNLVTNAVKYGHPDLPITVQFTSGQGRVSLKVHNFGPPIEASEQASLFLPFYRTADAHGGAARGHGLGLSTVQSIARAHGGSVFLSSSAEGGTTFDVSFPATLA